MTNGASKTSENTGEEPPVILHLSDLHFGRDVGGQKNAERKLVLDQLADKVVSLDAAWRPTVVCITGDISWRACEKDYEDAGKWIEDLLRKIGLDNEHLVLCPGNHDIDRDQADRIPRPEASNSSSADKALSAPIPPFYEDIFSNTAVPTFSSDSSMID